jgi:hypothetical protein
MSCECLITKPVPNCLTTFVIGTISGNVPEGADVYVVFENLSNGSITMVEADVTDGLVTIEDFSETFIPMIPATYQIKIISTSDAGVVTYPFSINGMEEETTTECAYVQFYELTTNIEYYVLETV